MTGKKADFGSMIDSGAPAGNDEVSSLALREEDPAPMQTVTFSSQPVFTREDIQFPRLKLGQSTTPEVQDDGRNFRAGEWIITGAETSVQELYAVPLLVAKPRSLYHTEGPNKDKLRCSSPDSIQGHGDPGVLCADCPFSQWTDRPSHSTNAPPACTAGYEYLMAIVNADGEVEAVVTWRAQKTAIAAAKTINMFIATKGIGNFGVKLVSISKARDGGGKYFMPKIVASKISSEALEMARAFIPA